MGDHGIKGERSHHHQQHQRTYPMTRTENLQAMQALHVAAYTAPTPEAALNIHRAYFLHQVIEAILSENVASLPEA